MVQMYQPQPNGAHEPRAAVLDMVQMYQPHLPGAHVPPAAPLFEMVQLYQHPLAPILCNAPLMRSSLHGCCVHAHNVAMYHCRGGLNNCQVEQSFIFQ